MVHISLAKAVALIAISSPVFSNPIKKDTVEFDDLVYRYTLDPSEVKHEIVKPEYFTVPKDFQPTEEQRAALFNGSRAFQPPVLGERGVIGDDNRFQYDGLEYPFRPIGRVFFQQTATTGSLCSGVLIGPRHVLTARHCIGDNGYNGRFSPSYLNGDRLGSAGVVGILTDPDFASRPPNSPCQWKNDYAILILDQRIGEQNGYMFLGEKPDQSLLNQPIFNSCGYPSDKGSETKWCQYGRTAKSSTGCDAYGPVSTDVDAVPGQSGSPVWAIHPDGTWWIWGAISVSSNSETIIASGDVMMLGWQFAMAGWP